MIFLLTLAAGLVLASLAWKRMDALESAISDLTDRIATLEQWDERDASPAVASPARKTSEAPQNATVPPPSDDRRLATPPVRTLSTPTSAPPSTLTSAPTAAPTPSSDASSRRQLRHQLRHAAPATTPPPATPLPAVSPMAASSETPRDDSLETRIGSRWLLYIGVVAIVVGVSYFEKLAIDNRWIGETARTLQGAILGLAFVVVGLRFVRAGYRLYGQVLSGCGVAVLYVSTYAAFNLYHLITRPVAFMLMALVTTLAAWLADRQRSQSLAIVAVGGGFATPFLLPSSIDAHIALFGYETILIAGTMFLARRREWPTLNIVSYAFTVLTVAAWAGSFYDASKYLSTELFLTVFCAMYLYILRESRAWQHPTAAAGRAMLWTAPFVYYVVSLAVLWRHSPALLVYLVALSLVGAIVSARAPSWTRLAFSVAVAAPLLLWSDAHGGRTWLAAGLAAWTGVYLLGLISLLEATLREDASFGIADIAVLHLNGLAAFAGAYLLMEPVNLAATAPLAAALAAWHGVLGRALWNRHREEALHFVALTFTLLTIAVALRFDGAWITSAWAAEGAAVIWLGLRERRVWLRAGGLYLFFVAIDRLISLQFSAPAVGQLLLLNGRAACSIFVIALTYLLTLAHHRHDHTRNRMTTGIGLVTAQLLTLALAASEIMAYWTLHPRPPFEPRSQVVAASLIIGMVTMWLGLVRRQEWIRGVGGVVVALGAFLLLSAQFEPAPPGYVTLLNGRAMAGLFAVLMLYGLAVVHRRLGSHLADLPVNLAVLLTAASLFTLSALTSEIDAFWAARGAADTWSIAREGLQAIAWAGVGGFLIWRGLSTRRTWIRAIGGVVLATAILRLLRAEFVDASPTYVVAANARVLAAIAIIGLLHGLARLYRDAEAAPEARYAPRTILTVLANVLTLTLLTSEITAYWHLHDVRQLSTSASADSHFAREMMLSVTWAVYATVLIVVGLWKRYAPIRYFAMTVFVITIVKVFAIDLAELDRIYRVLSVVGLGVMLLMTSYLYHRFRIVADKP